MRTRSPIIKDIQREGIWGLPDIGIPAAILFHPQLTPNEKILFGFIRNLSQTKVGCWATNRFLGKLLNKGPQTISNSIANLQKHGFIDVILSHKKETEQVQRNIFINYSFLSSYQSMTEEINELTLSNEDKTLLKNIYGDIKNFIGGYKKTYTKEDKEEVNNKKKNNKKKNVSQLKLFPSNFRRNKKFSLLWKRWEAYRKQINKPYKTSNKVAEISKWDLSDAILAIEISLNNEYQGLFKPNNNKNQSSKFNKHGGIKPKAGKYDNVKTETFEMRRVL